RSLGLSASGTFTSGGGAAGAAFWVAVGVGGGDAMSVPSTIARRSAAIALKRSPRGGPFLFGPGLVRSVRPIRLPFLPQPYWWQAHCFARWFDRIASARLPVS